MQETAQEKIRELFHSTVCNSLVVFNFDLYDSSVSQKLWSTEYYRNQLLGLDINKFQVMPPTSDTQSYGSSIIQTPMLDIWAYCSHFNLYIDGFFMNAMSTLDTLAHELFVLYESHRVPRRIYIDNAKDMLLNSHTNSAAGELLSAKLSEPWFTEFEPFRHCTTHESLIRHSDIIYRFDYVAGNYKLSRKIKLPDNPQVKPFTYNRNRVSSEYCRSIFRKIHSLVTNVYKSALRDICTNGNVLPIPVP